MISIKNLTKEFSGQKVLDGIDIDIEKGEVVALVGASGAGKSTILRSLNYLEQPDSGTITIDDFKVDFETITKEQIDSLVETGHLPIKEDKEEKNEKDETSDDSASLENNLFDLIESMYEDKEE